MCGKPIATEEDTRYVVKVEVYATCDSMDDDCEFDEELITEYEEDEEDNDEETDNYDSDDIEDVEYRTFRFDLCSKCHSKYLQDPLSIKSIRRGRFSEN